MYVAHRLHCRRRCERSMLLEFFMSDFARRVREYITYKRRRNMGKVENEGMPVVRLDRQLKYQGNILKIY